VTCSQEGRKQDSRDLLWRQKNFYSVFAKKNEDEKLIPYAELSLASNASNRCKFCSQCGQKRFRFFFEKIDKNIPKSTQYQTLLGNNQ
jgi:hypothetical protein